MTQTVEKELAVRARLRRFDHRDTSAFPPDAQPVLNAYKAYTLDLAYKLATASPNVCIQMDQRLSRQSVEQSLAIAAQIAQSAGYHVPTVKVVHLSAEAPSVFWM